MIRCCLKCCVVSLVLIECTLPSLFRERVAIDRWVLVDRLDDVDPRVREAELLGARGRFAVVLHGRLRVAN